MEYKINIQNSVAILSKNRRTFQKANMESVSLITESKRIKCQVNLTIYMKYSYSED